MNWETIEIGKKTHVEGIPFASVGHGRMALSAAACELVANYGNYHYVKLLRAKENGKTIWAVLFLMEKEDNCLPLKRKTVKGKVIGGIEVTDRTALREMFGDQTDSKSVKRFDVSVDSKNPKLLVIREQ